jgi:hypothetical protein
MNLPHLDNQTDFEVPLPQLLLDKDGEQLVTIVKATFEVPARGGQPELAPPERQRPVRMADLPWGKPEVSSIAYPADLCLRKPGTDVIAVARAFAPGGKPVPRFDVLVRVGHLEKALVVYGLRVWQAKGEGLSEPRPIDEIELRYEHAWGGLDESDPSMPVEEPRNPVGRGISHDPNALTHQLAPQLEDPAHPLKNARTRPPRPASAPSAATGSPAAITLAPTTAPGATTGPPCCLTTSMIASTSAPRRGSPHRHPSRGASPSPS